MASVQSTISFPAKKRFSLRLKKNNGKENKSEISVRKEENIPEKELTPIKRHSTEKVLQENGASPPKQKKVDSPIKERNNVVRKLYESPIELPIKDDDVSDSEETKEKRKEYDSLTKAIKVLHSSQPTRLYGRDDKVEEITSVLLKSLNKKESTTLYISGPPGTGKTACINHILSQPNISGNFKTVYVNCTGLKSANAAFKRIAEALGLKNESSEKKIQLSVEKHLQTCKTMIMLVLDEMDQLESKKQSLLYTIFEWPSIYRSNLVLIGIANALDLTDRVLPRLQAKLDVVPKLFHFRSYSKDEIMEILTERLKEGGVDTVLTGGPLQLLAGKVAAVSGDIRKALDIGRRVIEITQSKAEDGKQVALLDVLSVVNNVYGTSATLDSSEKGESFPLHQKILICAMVLIKKNSKVKEITIGRLHDVYRKVCAKRNMSSLDLSEFISLTELVESRGVIRIIGKMKNRLSKVVLLWDESEITNALQDKQLLASILDDVTCLK